jgi:citrate lyase subunit beta/citryl-CoA lyase
VNGTEAPLGRWRSLLFVPANDPVRLAKAASRGADAIIVDLEDAVAVDEKPAARAGLAEVVRALHAVGVPVVIRINAEWQDASADLEVAVIAGVTALMVPKADSPNRLSILSDSIAEHERNRGLEVGAIKLIALIESPAGLPELARTAAIRRVAGLALGTEDFSLALGVSPEPACLDLPCRLIALAAAPRRLMALAVPISIAAFRDEPGWRAATTLARAYGCTGALCIHPAQVVIANQAFTPSDAERAEAQAILQAWKDGGGENAGVVTLKGKMIDRPVLLRAQAILSA